MSLATMSSVDGGNNVGGSTTAALINVPQPAVVQPPRRSQAPRVTTVKTMYRESEGRRGMALNISPRAYRRNLLFQGLAPGSDDSGYDFFEGYGSSQNGRERRFPAGWETVRPIPEGGGVRPKS